MRLWPFVLLNDNSRMGLGRAEQAEPKALRAGTGRLTCGLIASVVMEAQMGWFDPGGDRVVRSPGGTDKLAETE